MQRSNRWLARLGFGAAVAAAAWFGSRYSPKNPKTESWYKSLEKPPFNPPDAVFPIVWSNLYTLMTISGMRVWRAEDSPERTVALGLWVAQLAANAAWTKLFFGEQLPGLALGDLLVLEGAIIAYIVTSEKVDRTAALCFVPYAAWVAFAGLLNAEIVRRNPHAKTVLAPHAEA